MFNSVQQFSVFNCVQKCTVVNVRKSHLRKSYLVGLPEVGLPEGNLYGGIFDGHYILGQNVFGAKCLLANHDNDNDDD